MGTIEIEKQTETGVKKMKASQIYSAKVSARMNTAKDLNRARLAGFVAVACECPDYTRIETPLTDIRATLVRMVWADSSLILEGIKRDGERGFCQINQIKVDR